jgi:hypothetical protein
MALTVITLTFLVLSSPPSFAFPLLFFLVVVPWPTVIEAPLIQALTQANATCAIELLNLFGVPALQHGNLIEIGTGMLGLNEACSGIRSFCHLDDPCSWENSTG